jgi:hypothetical protein
MARLASMELHAASLQDHTCSSFQTEEKGELFIMDKKAMGFGGHRYDKSNDHDAAMVSKNGTEKGAV